MSQWQTQQESVLLSCSDDSLEIESPIAHSTQVESGPRTVNPAGQGLTSLSTAGPCSGVKTDRNIKMDSKKKEKSVNNNVIDIFKADNPEENDSPIYISSESDRDKTDEDFSQTNNGESLEQVSFKESENTHDWSDELEIKRLKKMANIHNVAPLPRKSACTDSQVSISPEVSSAVNSSFSNSDKSVISPSPDSDITSMSQRLQVSRQSFGDVSHRSLVGSIFLSSLKNLASKVNIVPRTGGDNIKDKRSPSVCSEEDLSAGVEMEKKAMSLYYQESQEGLPDDTLSQTETKKGADEHKRPGGEKNQHFDEVKDNTDLNEVNEGTVSGVADAIVVDAVLTAQRRDSGEELLNDIVGGDNCKQHDRDSHSVRGKETVSDTEKTVNSETTRSKNTEDDLLVYRGESDEIEYNKETQSDENNVLNFDTPSVPVTSQSDITYHCSKGIYATVESDEDEFQTPPENSTCQTNDESLEKEQSLCMKDNSNAENELDSDNTNSQEEEVPSLEYLETLRLRMNTDVDSTSLSSDADLCNEEEITLNSSQLSQTYKRPAHSKRKSTSDKESGHKAIDHVHNTDRTSGKVTGLVSDDTISAENYNLHTGVMSDDQVANTYPSTQPFEVCQFSQTQEFIPNLICGPSLENESDLCGVRAVSPVEFSNIPHNNGEHTCDIEYRVRECSIKNKQDEAHVESNQADMPEKMCKRKFKKSKHKKILQKTSCKSKKIEQGERAVFKVIDYNESSSRMLESSCLSQKLIKTRPCKVILERINTQHHKIYDGYHKDTATDCVKCKPKELLEDNAGMKEKVTENGCKNQLHGSDISVSTECIPGEDDKVTGVCHHNNGGADKTDVTVDSHNSTQSTVPPCPESWSGVLDGLIDVPCGSSRVDKSGDKQDATKCRSLSLRKKIQKDCKTVESRVKEKEETENQFRNKIDLPASDISEKGKVDIESDQQNMTKKQVVKEQYSSQSHNGKNGVESEKLKETGKRSLLLGYSGYLALKTKIKTTETNRKKRHFIESSESSNSQGSAQDHPFKVPRTDKWNDAGHGKKRLMSKSQSHSRTISTEVCQKQKLGSKSIKKPNETNKLDTIDFVCPTSLENKTERLTGKTAAGKSKRIFPETIDLKSDKTAYVSKWIESHQFASCHDEPACDVANPKSATGGGRERVKPTLDVQMAHSGRSLEVRAIPTQNLSTQLDHRNPGSLRTDSLSSSYLKKCLMSMAVEENSRGGQELNKIKMQLLKKL